MLQTAGEKEREETRIKAQKLFRIPRLWCVPRPVERDRVTEEKEKGPLLRRP
jgi:hypothetical protein